MSDRDREADHARRKALYGVCRSWRIRREGWFPRIVRCSWPADHVEGSRWHCAEDTTGHVWLVEDRERTRFTAPHSPAAAPSGVSSGVEASGGTNEPEETRE